MGDICANRHKGSSNSVAANEKISPHKNKQRNEVLDIIKKDGPIHCELIYIKYGVRYPSASARISELKKMGLIKVVGRTTTTSGSTAALYEAI